MMNATKVNCIDILCHPDEDDYFRALSILKQSKANSSNQGGQPRPTHFINFSVTTNSEMWRKHCSIGFLFSAMR